MNKAEQLKLQSTIFDLAKWPMMVLVVLIHTLSNVIHPVPLPLSLQDLGGVLLDGGGIYLIISELISHSFGRVAVPFFFFISGYLLLYKEDYSPSFYAKNLKKKARTLLVPYIIWNFVCLGAYWLKTTLSARLGLEVYDRELEILAQPLWYHFVESINFPLWYVRDLMVMNLLLPAFYYLFKYTKPWGILLLYICYIVGLELPLPGFGSAAMLYVGSGIYCGWHKVDVLTLCHRYRYAALVGLMALMFTALFNNQHPQVEYLIRLYIPLGIISTLNAMAWIYRRSLRKGAWSVSGLCIRFCRYCLPASFFVYVTHTLFVNKTINSVLNALGNGSGYWQLFVYFSGVGITIAVCILGYKLLSRLSPRLMVVLTGGRA